MSAAVSTHPALAKGSAPIALRPVVYRDLAGRTHHPDAKNKLTRCGALLLARLSQGTLEASDHMCARCQRASYESPGQGRRGR